MALSKPDIFFKWKIKKTILDNLYTPALNKLKREQCKIVKDNGKIQLNTDAPVESFIYLWGVRYYSLIIGMDELAHNPNFNCEQTELLPNYKELIVKNIRDIQELKEEQRVIEGYLNMILNICNTYTDVLKLLPKSVRHIQGFKPNRPGQAIDALTLQEGEINKYRRLCLKPVKLLNERIIINLIHK